MGRKSKKQQKPVELAQPEELQDDGDFAAQLLAEMGESEEPTNNSPSSEKIEQPQQVPKPKRNRRKEKLAQRDADQQKLMQEAALEAQNMPDHRGGELDTVHGKIASRGLEEYDIMPDGHCLFASLADQLEHKQSISVDAQALRQAAAEYILAHQDDFTPYLLNEETGELRDVEEYCRELVDQPIWGGELEISALSNVYQSPVEIIMDGPPLVIGESFTKPKLVVAYYTKLYGLGAHYNSVREKR